MDHNFFKFNLDLVNKKIRNRVVLRQIFIVNQNFHHAQGTATLKKSCCKKRRKTNRYAKLFIVKPHILSKKIFSAFNNIKKLKSGVLRKKECPAQCPQKSAQVVL